MLPVEAVTDGCFEYRMAENQLETETTHPPPLKLVYYTDPDKVGARAIKFSELCKNTFIKT